MTDKMLDQRWMLIVALVLMSAGFRIFDLFDQTGTITVWLGTTAGFLTAKYTDNKTAEPPTNAN